MGRSIASKFGSAVICVVQEVVPFNFGTADGAFARLVLTVYER